jgi:hypothetical protein
MSQISMEELDKMIRGKIKTQGLSADISEEKVNEIKNKIKEAALSKNNFESIAKVEPGDTAAVLQSTIENEKSVEIAKKEGELEQALKDLKEKEEELRKKEEELRKKEEELSYKPQLPEFLDKVNPEEFIIFSPNEISFGAEGLSNIKFRLKSNPDDKKTMHEIWLDYGKKSADVYMIKLEKFGKISFNPFNGTSVFEEKRFEVTDTPEEGAENKAVESQEPKEEMIDAIEPIKDVALPMTDDMGLSTIDVEKLVKDKVMDILKNYIIGNKE